VDLQPNNVHDAIKKSRSKKGSLKTHDGELIFVVEVAPEGGFTARALGQSIFTEADDIATLHKNIRDSVHCHFEDPALRPKIIRLHFIREELIAV